MKDYLHKIWKNLQKNKKTLLESYGFRYLNKIFAKNPFLSIFFVEIILGIIFFLIIVFVSAQTENLKPFPLTTPTKIAQFPLLDRSYMPTLSAQAAYVLDSDSKVVIFSKNENLRFSPASTTKIMTALTGLDYFSLQDKLLIQRDHVQPVVIGFPKGVSVTFENLLYSMFLPSGNDAAYAIGDNYPGGENAFVGAMNKKAESLQLLHTHYGDPVGLLDDQDYTTPRDLAFLASFAISNETLKQIVSTKTKVITDSRGNSYTLKNINELLGKYGVNGLKTGYTEEAGQVLVTSTILNNHEYIIVVMKSDDRFADTEKLLQLLLHNVSYLSIQP